MLNSRVRALAVKDLRLHARSIIVTQVGLIAFGALGRFIRPGAPPDDLGWFLYYINFLMAGFWGDWFVSREKVKGTAAWLRSLPLSDADIVASKLVAQAVCTVPLWVACSGLFLWRFFVPGRVGTWVVLLLGLLAFGGVSLAARWRFHQKAGQLLPFGIVGVLLVLLTLVEHLVPDATTWLGAVWQSVGGKAAVAASLVFCYIAAWWATLRWVRRCDTSMLLE